MVSDASCIAIGPHKSVNPPFKTRLDQQCREETASSYTG